MSILVNGVEIQTQLHLSQISGFPLPPSLQFFVLANDGKLDS